MEWEVAALSDVGRRRHNNEDALLVRRDLGVFAVADGMGGHVAGEVASRLAVDTVAEAIAAEPRLADGDLAERVLRATFHAANRRILEDAAANPRRAGMGTTLSVLLLLATGDAFRIAHVGDSRIYRLRAGRLEQLTRDHTWVQQQVSLGLLTPEQAKRHGAAAVLTQALGATADLDVDIVAGDVRLGDVLLLCSDGLTGVVDDAALAGILAQPGPVADAAAALVEAANHAGGPDNISVIVLRAGDAVPGSAPDSA